MSEFAFYSDRIKCVCGHSRGAHDTTQPFNGQCVHYDCNCKGFDSLPCSRGSDGCEIQRAHSMCGMVTW